MISVIIGEGGSGGAVAFASANKVAMLEHSVYSVISPEGCASILWKDAEKNARSRRSAAPHGAGSAQAGASSIRSFPNRWVAHKRDRAGTIAAVGKAIETMLAPMKKEKARNPSQGSPQEVPRHGVKGVGCLKLSISAAKETGRAGSARPFLYHMVFAARSGQASS